MDTADTTTRTAPDATDEPVRLSRSGRYWAWLASDTLQALGSSMQFFLIPILVALTTGSTTAAGTVAALGLGARLATTLIGGVLNDRHDLRRLMILGGVLAAGIVILMAASMGLSLGLIMLGGLNFLAGVRAGLLAGASNVALKQVVHPTQLPTASSANQARDAVVSMGGPPLGGLLTGLSPVLALGATAAAYLGSAISALLMRGDFSPDRNDAPSSVLRDIGEGLRWLWAQPQLRRVLIIALLLNLGLNTTINTLLLDLATSGEDPARIGLISTGMGLGMLVGAVFSAPVVNRFPSGWVMTVGLCFGSASVVVLPFVPGFWWTVAVLAVGVLGAPMINAAALSYFMHQAPRAVVGRAMSAVELVAGGAVPLAPIVAGWGLAIAGLQSTLFVGAGICFLAVICIITDRKLRTLPKPSEWPPAAD